MNTIWHNKNNSDNNRQSVPNALEIGEKTFIINARIKKAFFTYDTVLSILKQTIHFIQCNIHDI